MKTKLLSICLASLALVSCKEASIPAIPQTADKDIAVFQKDIPFSMPTVAKPVFDNYEVSIEQFGGIGDGQADNSEAFAKAMKGVSERGGGHLIVPRGVWCTGPIYFEDNVDLHLKDGAVILFSKNYDDYPIVDTYFEGLDTKRCTSPLTADNKVNIAITGFGTLDGNGDAWRWVKKSKVTESQWQALLKKGGCTNDAGDVWYPTEAIKAACNHADMNVIKGVDTPEGWKQLRDYLRPVMLNFTKCKNVLLEGVCFQNSPAWNLHPFLCENVIINGVTVINPWYSQNGDGLDLESCKNALIVNSKFDVGDDAICIKSGKDKAGRDLKAPCENVIVDNCAVYHGHGGFVVGSEMSSGVKNISVKNCMFLGTDVGLRFKSTRGRGGVVENIHIDNINMINIPTDCILFDLYYSGKSASEALADGDTTPKETVVPPVTEETPCFRDIYINNVTCQGALRAMYFNGLPEMPVTNINVSNSQITATRGLELNESDSVKINNVKLFITDGEALKTYHVNNLSVDNVICNGDTVKVVAEKI